MAVLTGSMNVDSPSVVGLELGLWFAFGLYCFVVSVADHRQRPLRRRLWGDRPLRADRWYRLLLSWDIVRPEDADSILPGLVGRVCRQVTAYQGIGYGLANCLAVLCYLGIGLFQRHLAPPNGYVIFFGLQLSFVIGNLGGHLVGGVWLRARSGQTVSYGDPRQRRLGDYRSLVFLVWSLTFVAVQAELTLITATPGTAGLAVYPLLSLAVVFCTEALLHYVIQEPRLPLLPDPARARRLDDMLRSQALRLIQGSGLYCIGFLGLLQGILVDRASGTNGWVIVMYGTSAVCFGLGLVTFEYLRGRMGGTLTGWRWEKGLRPHGPAAARP